jgi:hypothetical protein
MTENIWNKLDDKLTKKNQLGILPLKSVIIKELDKEISESPKNEELKNEKEHEPIARKNLRFMNKKRGRIKKEKKENYKSSKTHDKFSDDNLKRKVKTHFHNFIIAFLNMKSKHILGNKNKFGKISSEITQNITVEYNQNLFQKQIKDIIIQISEKYQDKNKNRNILQELMKNGNQNDEIFTILNTNYKDMYINYYLKSNKKTFEGEEDESYQAHLEKLRKSFGDLYVENYKRNAESLITFFYKVKKRERKKNPEKLQTSDSILIKLPDKKNDSKEYLYNINNNKAQISSINREEKSTQTERVESGDEDSY